MHADIENDAASLTLGVNRRVSAFIGGLVSPGPRSLAPGPPVRYALTMPPSPPALSLVIPVRNERDNVRPLLAEVRAALESVAWEAVFVDDSDDGTGDVVEAEAACDPRVQLVRRTVNAGGLAGAVMAGFGRAHGRYVCVLDGDLQHPPARIPAMLAKAEASAADVVIASRYIRGGSMGGLDGPTRLVYARGLRALAKVAFPRRLRGVSDPLGGFFLVRGELVCGVTLRPRGYKILLEILVRCRPRTVREVPYRFQPRRHGETKADLRQGIEFLRHLWTLRVWPGPRSH